MRLHIQACWFKAWPWKRTIEFQMYFKGFRTDKIAARMDAIWLVVFGLLIAFLVMTDWCPGVSRESS